MKNTHKCFLNVFFILNDNLVFVTRNAVCLYFYKEIIQEFKNSIIK